MKLNPAGITATLNQREALALLGREARAVADLAADFERRRAGRAAAHYKATRPHAGPRGAQASAYTDHIAGHIFEFGSAQQAPRAPLRRAALARGLHLTESKRGE